MPNVSPAVSRRGFLWGGAALLAAGGLTAGAYSQRHGALRWWIDKVIAEALPGHVVPDDSRVRLLETALERKLMSVTHHHWLARANEYMPTLKHLRPDAFVALEEAKRKVLTELMLGSAFFMRPTGSREPLAYHPSVAICGNPFAVFRDSPA